MFFLLWMSGCLTVNVGLAAFNIIHGNYEAVIANVAFATFLFPITIYAAVRSANEASKK